MKRTILIAVTALFLGSTLASCSKDLCPAYSKDYKANVKKAQKV